MRTGSRLQQAKEALDGSFSRVAIANDLPYLLIGIIPVFFEDFLVDVRLRTVHLAVANLSRTEPPESGPTVYTFDGLERRENQYEYTVRFHRSGLLTASLQLPLIPQRPGAEAVHLFQIAAIDLTLRRFVLRANVVYEAAGIAAPFILGMMLRTRQRLVGGYAGLAGALAQTPGVNPSVETVWN